MKKLKIKSLFDILILCILIISIGYTLLILNNPPKNIYKKGYSSISGTIIKCEQDNDKTAMVISNKESIKVNYYDKFNCKLGLKVKVTGEIEKPSKNTIFNIFNYQSYLQSQKIFYTMKADTIKVTSYKIKKSYLIKNNIQNYINTYKSKNYLNAFILGKAKEIDEEVINSYRANGISHLLAISGMHITLISSILLFLLNKLFKHKKINYFIVILCLIFYMFLASFTPSVTRATFLFIALTIKDVFHLKTESIYILILIFALFLLNNPFVIYHLGFQFSFIITFFLMLFSDYFMVTKGYFKNVFNVSVVAFLASMPILMFNFFEINILSPFLNVIFVPFVSIIVFPLSLLSLIIKPLDNLLINLIDIMEKLSLIFSKIEALKIILQKPSLLMVFIYFLVILYVISGFMQRKKIRIGYLIIILIVHYNIYFFENDISITMLDVGQGDSTLISVSGKNILIDTGGQVNFKGKPYELVKNKTIPFLKSKGIKKIEYLILSHGDYDHMGEAISLVNNFRVEKVIFNQGELNFLEKRLIKVLDKKKIKYYQNRKNIKMGKHQLYFLKTKQFNNENDNSNINYLKINNLKFLFMGDGGISTEEDILNKYNLPDIDVLKVGHHGSKTSSSKEFINEINPKYSVISVGKNNRYGHPNKEVLDNLKDTKIYRTDKDGSIMFKIKNNKFKIETCSP